MHALIIEQDAWVALMIEEALRDLGYETFDLAASGEDAIQMATHRCPDLITSDVRLGAMNGIEAVGTICSRHTIPVVFVTATGWEVRPASPRTAVVQKPFAPNDLKAAIGQATSATVPHAG